MEQILHPRKWGGGGGVFTATVAQPPSTWTDSSGGTEAVQGQTGLCEGGLTAAGWEGGQSGASGSWGSHQRRMIKVR